MTRAQEAQMNSLLLGGGLAALAAFVWTKRGQLFPAAVAPSPTPANPNPPAYAPVITAPAPLPQGYPVAPLVPVNTPAGTVVAPGQIVVNTPQGPAIVKTSDIPAGCVIGAHGGLECPNPGQASGTANVTAAQRNPCLPPIAQEVDACLVRKPTWTRDYATTRLTQLRQAVCSLMNGPYSVAQQMAISGHVTDYQNLTGVALAVAQGVSPT